MREKLCYLIWQHHPKSSWEADWIRYLFSNIPFTELFDYGADGFGYQSIVLDRAILIDNRLTEASHRAYYKKFKAENYRCGLIHLSDENFADQTSLYDSFDFVLRNYWSPAFLKQSKVLTFPLGYKNGFQIKPSLPSASERPYVWSFIGQITKSTRIKMFNHVIGVPDGYIYLIEKFNDPSAMPVEGFQAVLEKTIFALCPMGFYNPDTFRVYEALEAGCIPIVENISLAYNNQNYPYFSSYLPNPPFVIVNDWAEIKTIFASLMADPEKLEARRQACEVWWRHYKQELAQKLPGFIQSHWGGSSS